VNVLYFRNVACAIFTPSRLLRKTFVASVIVMRPGTGVETGGGASAIRASLLFNRHSALRAERLPRIDWSDHPGEERQSNQCHASVDSH
jgi:hypothetical protein